MPDKRLHPLRPWLGWLSPLRQRDLSLREKGECLRFYLTAYGERRLFATLPRSGYNYLALMLHVAMDLSRGGAGTYRYVDQAWCSPMDVQQDFNWQAPLKRAREGNLLRPVMFHTHRPYEQLVNARRASMRVIVLVRHLVEQLESALFHAGYTEGDSTAFLAGGALEESIDFCNSWSAYVDRRPETLVLRYEDLTADPLSSLRRVAQYWALELPDSVLREAVQRCRREAMLAQIPSEQQPGNPRVSVRPTRGVFSPEEHALILSRCRARLRGRFGYRYDPRPQPTHAPVA